MRTVRFHNSSTCVHDVQVTILPTRQEFLRYAEARRRGDASGCQALMLGHNAAQVQRGCPQSELVFSDESFTPANVAHEVSHALIWAFHQAALSFNDPADEELFATLHGLLTQNILDWHTAP